MQEVPVIVQGVSWSRAHGHPIVILRALEGDLWYGVACDVEEARALSTCECSRTQGRRRLARLTLDLLDAVGSRIDAIVLFIDEPGMLQAEIAIDSAGRRLTVPAAGLDALLLAEEYGIVPSLRIHDLPPYGEWGANRSQGMHDSEAKPEGAELPTAILDLLQQLKSQLGPDTSRE